MMFIVIEIVLKKYVFSVMINVHVTDDLV